VKTEIVLNAFTGYCYVCKRKGTGLYCPNKEVKKSDAGGTGRYFKENCNQFGAKDTRKFNAGNFQRMNTKDLLDAKRMSIWSRFSRNWMKKSEDSCSKRFGILENGTNGPQ